MTSLKSFPPLPTNEQINLCEIDKKIQCMPIENANISIFTNTVSSYPTVAITRDLLRSSTTIRDDVGDIFLPVQEPMTKKVLNAWYENGVLEALHVMAEPQETYFPAILQHCASFILKIVNGIFHVSNKLQPHLRASGTNLIAALSQTRDWQHSPVRCMAWHPHSTKLAVAIRDDSVHIYTTNSNHKPFLKYKNMKNIACLVWRPLSVSELAIGCEAGVYVWNIDPSSSVTRLSINNALFLRRPGHTPVTSVSWSPEGDVLLTASAADIVMYVWDLAMDSFSAIKKVHGGGVSLVTWSNNRLFASTIGVIFRVWETNHWTPEQWNLSFGHIKTACWSPCGSVLLFANSEEALIYSLSFTKTMTVFLADSEKASRNAIPVIDCTSVELESGEIAGGLAVSIVWDPSGQYVAVIFKDSNLIAVFRTKLKPIFQVTPCCFINGILDEVPNVISFQQNYSEGALLTIAWSSGRVQYFPFVITSIGVEESVNESFFSGRHESIYHNSTLGNLSYVSF